ncbi:hypothetical protein [Bacillus kexueae]|uniref:hypothetical protein n=1 Tax=Aeribacillus kexueae TaxID=2078952 RepID=UPI001FB03F03|nr:hypothetical protein [Bacillus kexueae]
MVKDFFQTFKKLTALDWLLIFLGVGVTIGLFLVIGTNSIFFQFAVLLLLTWQVIFVFVLSKQVKEIKSRVEHGIREEQPIETKDEKNEDMEKTLLYKEQELSKVELDKTILFEELLQKANLQEDEKQAFRNRMSAKEDEAKSIQRELLQLKTKFQKVTNFILQRDPALEEVVTLIGAEFIQTHTYDDINRRLQFEYRNLSDHAIRELKEAHMMTRDYTLTRIGYRELLKAARKHRMVK